MACLIGSVKTFSHVIKPSIIRVTLTLVVHFDWDLRQLDVMILDQFSNHVCKLRKRQFIGLNKHSGESLIVFLNH